MGTSYPVHEDEHIKIEVDEMSTTYGLTVSVKSGGEFPTMVIELFNDVPIEATALAEMGCNILYAAFLQMDERDIKAMKSRIANL